MPRRSFRIVDAPISDSFPRTPRNTSGIVAKSFLCPLLLWQLPPVKGTFLSDHVAPFFSRGLISCSAHRFRNSCKEAGKEVMVWTVNEKPHMMEVRIITVPNVIGPRIMLFQIGGAMGSKRDPD